MAIMPVNAIGTGGISNLAQLADVYRAQVMGADPTSAAGATSVAATNGSNFAAELGNSLKQLEGLDKTASDKAIQAATGDLTDIQDYVIAATQAQTATELTTTIRNKALESFNEIMRMPV